MAMMMFTFELEEAHAEMVQEAFAGEAQPLAEVLARVVKQAAGQIILDREIQEAAQAHEQKMKARGLELQKKLGL